MAGYRNVGVITINSLYELICVSKFFGADWIYRGVPNFRFNLIPKMERDQTYPDLWAMKSAEMYTIKEYKKIHKNLFGKPANCWDIISSIAHLQHYLDKDAGTRFLDFTENFWIAVWFAAWYSISEYYSEYPAIWAIKKNLIPAVPNDSNQIIHGKDSDGVFVWGHKYHPSKRQFRQEGLLLVPKDFFYKISHIRKGKTVRSMETHLAHQLGVRLSDLAHGEEIYSTYSPEVAVWKLKFSKGIQFKISILYYLYNNFKQINKYFLFPSENEHENYQFDVIEPAKKMNRLYNHILKITKQ